MMQTGLVLTSLVGVALASLPGPPGPSTVTQVVSTITATVSVTASPTIFSAVPQFTDNVTFTSAVLNSTNAWRSQYDASNLSWNQTLATFASSYLATMGPLALENGTECDFAHSGGPYGENIALGCTDVTGCVDLWGDEVTMYNYQKPNFSEQTGHFTQLVWKNTTDVGCDRRLCGLRQWYLVCEYWPRGNVIGDFGSMVGQQVNGSSAIDATSPMRWWKPKSGRRRSAKLGVKTDL